MAGPEIPPLCRFVGYTVTVGKTVTHKGVEYTVADAWIRTPTGRAPIKELALLTHPGRIWPDVVVPARTVKD
jgi:hypothetical protein